MNLFLFPQKHLRTKAMKPNIWHPTFIIPKPGSWNKRTCHELKLAWATPQRTPGMLPQADTEVLSPDTDNYWHKSLVELLSRCASFSEAYCRERRCRLLWMPTFLSTGKQCVTESKRCSQEPFSTPQWEDTFLEYCPATRQCFHQNLS